MPDAFPHWRSPTRIDRYGTDKPDLRFGLEIGDVTDRLGGTTELPMFAEAPDRDHVIRVLRAPGASGRSRKWFDGFADAAKKVGARAAGCNSTAAGLKGPSPGASAEQEAAVAIEAADAADGDAVLVRGRALATRSPPCSASSGRRWDASSASEIRS